MLLAALKKLEPPATDILDSHGISTKAWHRLKEGKGALFVDDRAAHLTERLRGFAEQISVPLGDEVVGIADDDNGVR